MSKSGLLWERRDDVAMQNGYKGLSADLKKLPRNPAEKHAAFTTMARNASIPETLREERSDSALTMRMMINGYEVEHERAKKEEASKKRLGAIVRLQNTQIQGLEQEKQVDRRDMQDARSTIEDLQCAVEKKEAALLDARWKYENTRRENHDLVQMVEQVDATAREAGEYKRKYEEANSQQQLNAQLASTWHDSYQEQWQRAEEAAYDAQQSKQDAQQSKTQFAHLGRMFAQLSSLSNIASQWCSEQAIGLSMPQVPPQLGYRGEDTGASGLALASSPTTMSTPVRPCDQPGSGWTHSGAAAAARLLQRSCRSAAVSSIQTTPTRRPQDLAEEETPEPKRRKRINVKSSVPNSMWLQRGVADV